LISSQWCVGVAIPAHNEEDTIGPCLDAVRQALHHPRLRSVPSFVVVVADRCVDRTESRAAQILGSWGTVAPTRGTGPGSARRSGFESLLSAFSGHRLDRTWLATTDADTMVPAHWLARQLLLARFGATAVAGTVEVDTFEMLPAGTEAAFERIYRRKGRRLTLLNDHPHVHGANLGVRADAYLEVGGWTEVACGEDNLLWAALRSSRRRVLSTSSVQVRTSGRLSNRVSGGFGGFLRELVPATGVASTEPAA
jgi:glycosyltransferase involved in cell wall biosynthesis